MPRKPNTTNSTRPFENALGDRISDLREKHGESQSDMAAALNLSQRATIEQWEKGTRFIKAGQLAEIARHFHVSADYLLGLTPVKTPETDLRAVCDFVGLDEKAVLYLNASVNECIREKRIVNLMRIMLEDIFDSGQSTAERNTL